MKVALIGPPQSGKSSLFTAASGQVHEAAHAGQEQVAVVKVPEPRLELLAEIEKPKKWTYATIDLLDTPAIDLSSPAGRNEFNRLVPSLRDCNGLVAVVRAFDDPSVPPHRGRIDPAADLKELHGELIFADLAQVANRLERLDDKRRKRNRLEESEKREHALLSRCQEALEAERPVREVIETDQDERTVRSFAFLTLKPLVVVVNVGEAEAAEPRPIAAMAAYEPLYVCAKVEAEIAQLDPADRPAFLADLGLAQPARDRLVHAIYQRIGLIAFLTGGPQEVRAWALPAGTPAIEAAGNIHTDMARGFIRAEVVAYDDLADAGDMKAAKAAGKVRLEGKQYILQDGDVVLFRFNV